MRRNRLEKLLLLALSTISAGSTWAAFGSGTENNMQVLWQQSNYNPHLNDTTVPADSSIVRVDGGQIRGSVHDGISIWASPMLKPGNALSRPGRLLPGKAYGT